MTAVTPATSFTHHAAPLPTALLPTALLPTDCALPRRYADFATMTEALDYAARGSRGLNFHNGRGELVEALSFHALREQALVLARKLRTAGFRRGERMAIVAETEGDFARSFFACQYAGLIPAPLPLPAAFGGKDAYISHLRHMIIAAGASAALGPDSLRDWVLAAAEGVPGVRLAGALRDLDALDEGAAMLEPATADEIAYLQFSSGSTRFPSGVAVRHSALLANIHGIAAHGLRIDDGDRSTSWLPFYHDMGLIGFLLTPVGVQMTTDYLPTREFARRPLVWLTLISRNRGTIAYSPSFGYELCARRAHASVPDGLDLSSWRIAGIGGDMIRSNVLEQFAAVFAQSGFDRRALMPSYGMAEATLAISFAPFYRGFAFDTVDMDSLENDGDARAPAANSARIRDFVLCGRVLPAHEVEIRGQDGRALGDRRLGRIFVRGPSLMDGYIDRPEETAAVLSADGWLDTGDVGYRIGEDLVITGRAKDLILVNGRNVWPQDLEWTAERTENLRSGDALAFSVDEGEGERIVLLVQARPTEAGAREALRASVLGVLRSEHGIDAEVVLVPPHSLPQTSSGKLSRSRGRQMYQSGVFELAPPEPQRLVPAA